MKAGKRLRLIGQRENRWMSDVNHQVSKALVKSAGKNALVVLEDLTGDRIAAMNLRNIGIEYVHAELIKQVP